MKLEDGRPLITLNTKETLDEGKFTNYPAVELREVIADMKLGITRYFNFKEGINKGKKYRFTKLAKDGTFTMQLDGLQ